ncbi:MAG: HD domain-containing protein [Thermaerobacter sp.]|nr:HD domain-containing protein [Thermaerobacter sp.]
MPRRSFLRSRSIQKKLVLLAVIGTAIIGILTSLLLFLSYRSYLLPTLEQKNRELAQEMATTEEIHLQQCQADVVALAAASPALSSRQGAALQRFLRRTLASQVLFNGLSVTDRQGRMIGLVPADPSLLGKSFLQRAYVRDALAGHTHVSQAFLAATGNYVVVVSAPIRNAAGQITGTLNGALHLELADNYLHVVSHIGKTGFILVYDPRGDIISSPRASLVGKNIRQLTHRSTAFPARRPFSFTLAGQTYVGSRVLVPATGWRVLAAQSSRELEGPLFAGLLRLALLLLLALAAAVLISVYLAERLLIRPLLEIGRVAEDLAKGMLSSRAALAGDDELGNLAASINHMADSIQHLTEDLETALLDTALALGKTVEEKDRYTEAHCERMAQLCIQVGRELGLSEPRLRTLRFAAVLHDVGKITVPSRILRKPGSLTPVEWQEITKHPGTGERIIASVAALGEVARIVGQHHEHYDGQGYPNGLAGEAIALEARIVGVVDAFDAMTSDRPYRKALTVEQALAELTRAAGTQFDPQVVQALQTAQARWADQSAHLCPAPDTPSV